MHRTASPFHQYAPVYYPQQYEHGGEKNVSDRVCNTAACTVGCILSPRHFFEDKLSKFNFNFAEQIYDEGYYGATSTSHQPVPFVRVVKRRTTANKKERRRTQSINSAFTYLRDCIPNVPSDTKLSKVSADRAGSSLVAYKQNGLSHLSTD